VIAVRADASLNRTRILDAAREMYGRKGLDVTSRAVARRAGVGVATLYRHFPTREELVGEAVTEELRLCTTLTEEALAAPDPWDGLRRVLETAVDTVIVNRGFSGLFLDDTHASEARKRVEDGICELALRAQQTGALRPDFTPTDLTMMVKATADLATTSPIAARRLAAYVMQSFTTTSAPLP
jgi:AcrR family transcriptional regulator